MKLMAQVRSRIISFLAFKKNAFILSWVQIRGANGSKLPISISFEMSGMSETRQSKRKL